MAKYGFNTNTVRPTTNPYVGGEMYKVSDAATRLIMTVGSAFFTEPQYYGKTGDIANHMIATATEIANGKNPEDLLIIARWARDEMNMRTTPMVLLAIAAHEIPTKEFTRRYIRASVKRADDVLQIFAAYLAMFGKPLPNSLRRGLSDAISKLTQWDIFRYKGNSHPNFKDVLKMVGRSDGYPLDKKTYNAIMNDTVDVQTATVQGESRREVSLADSFEDARGAILEGRLPWEPVISKFGSKKEVWEFLIENGLVGYMAMLRNLRNFEKVGISEEHWRIVEKVLVGKAGISRQLPFRYITAYYSVKENSTRTLVAKALDAVLTNGDYKLDGKTAILVDVSGSMDCSVSGESQVSLRTTAAALAGIIAKSGNADIVCFSDRADYFPYDGLMSVMTIVDKILHQPSGGTYAEIAIKKLNKHYDRIVMLSDMQTYGDSVQSVLNEYEGQYGATHYYSVNMAGYEVSPVNDKHANVTLLGGWSEKIINFIKEIENPRAIPVIEELRKKYRVVQ
jgi:lysophospholipase L1-like esterase